MPNENNTNQINSGDIGNFPDSALEQENHTHHSPAVREEAVSASAEDGGDYSYGKNIAAAVLCGSNISEEATVISVATLGKIQAMAEHEAKALDGLYEIPLGHVHHPMDPVLMSDIHIGSKLTGIHGDAGCVLKIAEDGIASPDVLDPRLVIHPFGFAHERSHHGRHVMFDHAHHGNISETEIAEKLKRRTAAMLHLTDLSPYSYIPPMQLLKHHPSVSSIRYDSSRKAKLRKIRQLKKRIAVSSGAKKYLFKEMLKKVKRVLNKINNSSLSGAHFATRRGKSTFKTNHKREREFLLYGIPFPVQKHYFPGTGLSFKDVRAVGEPVSPALRSSMNAVAFHASLTAQARRMSGFDGPIGADGGSDLAGTQNMRRGLARVREMADIAQRFSQGAVVRHEGPVGEYYTPDVSDYKRPDENCKGCDNCEKKLPVLELMEHGLDLTPAAGETISLLEQLGDVSVKDAYPEHYAIQEVAAPDLQAMGEMQGAIHETLFPGKIVAQGSIDRSSKGDDDAADDERFALDA